MSADAWSACPRCKVNGDIGYKSNEFREDYEIGLNDGWTGEEDAPPAILVNYRGECQHCGLRVTFEQRHPVTWEQPPPAPEPRPWSQIPAGWLVQHPKQPDVWLTVLATKFLGDGLQRVQLGLPDGGSGAWTYNRDAVVTCRPGEPSETDTALSVLGEGAYILEDEL